MHVAAKNHEAAANAGILLENHVAQEVDSVPFDMPADVDAAQERDHVMRGAVHLNGAEEAHKVVGRFAIMNDDIVQEMDLILIGMGTRR